MIRGLFSALVRIVLLPLKLAAALLGVTFTAGTKVAAVPARVGWAASRRVGWWGMTCFVGGVAAGLLLAPTSGRRLRATLTDALTGGRPDDAALVEAVTFELAHAPRTWHLGQPEVAVIEGVVVLRGEVPHDTARHELVRTSAAVPGVRDVRDELSLPAST